jgi:hypothetical protein
MHLFPAVTAPLPLRELLSVPKKMLDVGKAPVEDT